ncbi:MAG: hypothetical protein GXW96_10985 [Christensenellaceae bacterium]|nr:hypothetical protein [Christensenellaceae bacterium]
MRRIIAVISALCAMALLAACGAQSNTRPAAGESPSAPPSAEADYTGTDFSGHWAVSQAFDSEGAEVSADRLAELGFMLELLPDGTYFVYDAKGEVLGPGSYKVEKDIMILEAKGVQTIYTVIDANTLRGATADGCVTILTRQPEPEPTPDEPEPEDMSEGEDMTGEAEEEEEDIDIPEEDVSEENGSPASPSTEAALPWTSA